MPTGWTPPSSTIVPSTFRPPQARSRRGAPAFSASGVATRIEGLPELVKVLRQLPLQLQKKALDDAVRAGAQIVAAEARRLAPVRALKPTLEQGQGASPVLTQGGQARFNRLRRRKGRVEALYRLPGYLKKHIRVKKVRTAPDSAMFVVGPSRGAFYGMFVEFGTRFMPARPFLRPAWDANKGRVLEAIRDRLGQAVLREARKLAGTYVKPLRRRRG